MNDDSSGRAPENETSRSRQQTGVDGDQKASTLLTKNVVLPLSIRFQIKDVCEIVVGASVLAIPVAYTYLSVKAKNWGFVLREHQHSHCSRSKKPQELALTKHRGSMEAW